MFFRYCSLCLALYGIEKALKNGADNTFDFHLGIIHTSPIYVARRNERMRYSNQIAQVRSIEFYLHSVIKSMPSCKSNSTRCALFPSDLHNSWNCRKTVWSKTHEYGILWTLVTSFYIMEHNETGTLPKQNPRLH